MGKRIIIDGPPVAQKRARFARMGGFVKTYNPSSKEKLALQEAIRRQWQEDPLDGPISLHITFWMPMAASWSKKKKEAHCMQPHTVKPDCDNLLKLLSDSMTDIVFKDDAQVSRIEMTKIWSGIPYTEIYITHDEPHTNTH